MREGQKMVDVVAAARKARKDQRNVKDFGIFAKYAEVLLLHPGNSTNIIEQVQ